MSYGYGCKYGCMNCLQDEAGIGNLWRRYAQQVLTWLPKERIHEFTRWIEASDARLKLYETDWKAAVRSFVAERCV
jgi:hypothetical protein